MNCDSASKYLEKCETMEDFYTNIKNLNSKEKGDIFEYLTVCLFQLSPILNNGLDRIWIYKDIPSAIKKVLKLPEKDKGIDILAFIKGKFYAIQCKFRQNINTCITWTELATFFGLTFGINNKIAGGFFVTNTFDLCDQVIQSTKVKPIHGDFFDNLPEDFSIMQAKY